MKPTPSAWQDSAHAQRDIHRSPASAVTEICLLMSGCVLKRNGSKQIARSKLVGAVWWNLSRDARRLRFRSVGVARGSCDWETFHSFIHKFKKNLIHFMKKYGLDQIEDYCTFCTSLSLRLSLSPKFGLRPKISQKVKLFFVWTQLFAETKLRTKRSLNPKLIKSLIHFACKRKVKQLGIKF